MTRDNFTLRVQADIELLGDKLIYKLIDNLNDKQGDLDLKSNIPFVVSWIVYFHLEHDSTLDFAITLHKMSRFFVHLFLL